VNYYILNILFIDSTPELIPIHGNSEFKRPLPTFWTGIALFGKGVDGYISFATMLAMPARNIRLFEGRKNLASIKRTQAITGVT